VIVVDTNVVAYFVIAGAHTQHAETVRSRDADWRAPQLLIHEWLNVVALHVRRNLFDRDEAIRIYRRGLALVKIEPAPPAPIEVLNLVKRSDCSSYDCQFVALAEMLRIKLVTMDQQMLRAFPGITENLVLTE
jgi:predicted nucleic acid-binding protein